MSNAAKIGNNSLDAVAFAFDLGLKTLHLVAVEGVSDILCFWSTNCTHCGKEVFTRRILTVAMIAVKLGVF